MPEKQRYNVPSLDDPEFNSKISDLVKFLLTQHEKQAKNLEPIKTPDENLQVGDHWLDDVTGKIMVNTDSGVKAIKYE